VVQPRSTVQTLTIMNFLDFYLQVQACGVCHSDKFTVFNAYPGCSLPRVPGHEVIGTVSKVGDGVEWPKPGMMVGVGWHNNHCLFCSSCRAGDFMMCSNSGVSGIHRDGGYSEYMLVSDLDHWKW